MTKKEEKTKNDEAWERLLNDKPVLDAIKSDGHCDISSEDIKRYREPRLMCKIDFKENRPKIFVDNDLSILAIRNGTYRIAKTNTFIDINKSLLPATPHKTFFVPDHIDSLNANNITSEAKALDIAMISGMLNHLLDDKLQLTIRGREYSQEFNFILPNITSKNTSQQFTKYDIEGVQIEVDGGYEGYKSLLLVEAKTGLKDHMNVRQLLYPHINYQNKLTKPVMSYIMFYETTGRYFFIPFIYDGINSSFDSENTKYFQLNQKSSINAHQLFNVNVNNESTGHDAPFPQADNFEMVIEMLLKIGQLQTTSKEELFADFPLVSRQLDYYLNALKWLGYIEMTDKKSLIFLKKEGIELLKLSDMERVYSMARRAFSNEIFNLHLTSDNPEIDIQCRERNKLETDKTFIRRMKTVKSWKNYFFRRLDLS